MEIHRPLVTINTCMTKYITHWTVAFVTAFIMIGFHYNDSSVVQTARLKSFDILQQTDQPILSRDVAVVTIDEAAIETVSYTHLTLPTILLV